MFKNSERNRKQNVDIMSRLNANRERYIEKHKRKKAKEDNFYKNKYKF